MDRTNGFMLVGISVRTTNQDNKSVKDLGDLWGRFYSEQIINKIPNRVTDDLISAYTDYKSDYTDEYTTILGVQVSSLENIPQGLIGRQFSADTFEKVTVKGEMPEAVIDAWKDIWLRNNELNRKYSYDFEVYGAGSQNGIDSEMEIYISVRMPE
jgi:predicted transcriptional regulator YdeE